MRFSLGAMSLIVRAAQSEHLEPVARIYQHYVLTSTATFETVPPSRAAWEAKVAGIASAGWPFLVAELDGDVVGFGYASAWRARPAYAHTVEETVYLDGAATGRGVGTTLLAAVLDAAQQAGARQAIAVVSDRGAEGSLALHRKLGFVQAGHLQDVGEKFGLTLGTYLLQKSLTA